MRKIYIINGYPGSGKTTFGKLVGEELKTRNVNFLHTSSIDPIKFLLMPKKTWNSKIFPKSNWDLIEGEKRKITKKDWDGVTKDVYWRGVMSSFKQALLARLPNFINDYVISQSANLKEPSILFVDIREPANIVLFKSYCQKKYRNATVGAIFIESNLREDFDNPSDAQVKNYKYDYYFDNSRTENDSTQALAILKSKIKVFCSSYLLK